MEERELECLRAAPHASPAVGGPGTPSCVPLTALLLSPWAEPPPCFTPAALPHMEPHRPLPGPPLVVPTPQQSNRVLAWPLVPKWGQGGLSPWSCEVEGAWLSLGVQALFQLWQVLTSQGTS